MHFWIRNKDFRRSSRQRITGKRIIRWSCISRTRSVNIIIDVHDDKSALCGHVKNTLAFGTVLLIFISAVINRPGALNLLLYLLFELYCANGRCRDNEFCKKYHAYLGFFLLCHVGLHSDWS